MSNFHAPMCLVLFLGCWTSSKHFHKWRHSPTKKEEEVFFLLLNSARKREREREDGWTLSHHQRRLINLSTQRLVEVLLQLWTEKVASIHLFVCFFVVVVADDFHRGIRIRNFCGLKQNSWNKSVRCSWPNWITNWQSARPPSRRRASSTVFFFLSFFDSFVLPLAVFITVSSSSLQNDVRHNHLLLLLLLHFFFFSFFLFGHDGRLLLPTIRFLFFFFKLLTI